MRILTLEYPIRIIIVNPERKSNNYYNNYKNVKAVNNRRMVRIRFLI